MASVNYVDGDYQYCLKSLSSAISSAACNDPQYVRNNSVKSSVGPMGQKCLGSFYPCMRD